MKVVFRILAGAAVITNLAFVNGMLNYEITTTWNGGAIDHDPVRLTIEHETGTESDVRLSIESPFYNNEPPPGEPGEPLMGLWNYEVVEAFFLNDEEKYLEVEISPHGQHIVLLLYHPRNITRHSLPLKTSTYFDAETAKWSGYCIIPSQYFPFNVTLFNAYAVYNGPDGTRQYESLYPADPNDLDEPEFHALQYFKPIDFTQIIQDYPLNEESQLWVDSLQGTFRYHIETEWNDVPISHPNPIEFTFEKADTGVRIKVRAPYFNDPAPTEPAGSLMGLWNYEVAEVFFLNDIDEYLEIEFGPHGHYILLLLKGESNAIKDSLEINYSATITSDNFWTGEAIIPAEYFPPNVTKMNAYGIHQGNAPEKVYEALYPAPFDDPNYPNANFHKLDLFKKIDFEFLMEDNSQYSDVWLDAIGSNDPVPTTSFPSTTDASTRVDTVGSTILASLLALAFSFVW